MKIKRNKIFTLFNFILFTLLLLAFLVRIYRIDSLLGFYFDQGRDANVIWDLWHKGKFFLIGPTTGIEGVFRGPWYYWLIAPFYLLARGDRFGRRFSSRQLPLLQFFFHIRLPRRLRESGQEFWRWLLVVFLCIWYTLPVGFQIQRPCFL